MSRLQTIGCCYVAFFFKMTANVKEQFVVGVEEGKGHNWSLLSCAAYCLPSFCVAIIS